MGDTTSWISEAIHTLGLSENDIHLLEEEANAQLYDALENHLQHPDQT